MSIPYTHVLYFYSTTLRPQPAIVKEDKSQEQDLSFFESIGLYWVNPADRAEGQEKVQEQQEMEFLQELGLAPVQEPQPRWRLWQGGGAEALVEELLPQLYLPETEATDPTVMEERVEQELQEREQHWCEPCGRSLASAELLERHTLTELHASRAGGEVGLMEERREVKRKRFFDEQFPAFSGPNPTSKPTKFLKTDVTESPTVGQSQHCGGCRAPVQAGQIGKHLVSHYHYHR